MASAGKSTLLRAISELLRPRSGWIQWDGQTIGRLAPHVIVGRGISHAPGGLRVFTRLTVRGNLELGAYLRPARAARHNFEQILALFLRLRERLTQRAGTLSGGEQQMLTRGKGAAFFGLSEDWFLRVH